MEFREVTQSAVVIRILAAILAGGLIGLERGMKNRPAGLRTYMLVCVGSCLIMLINQYVYQATGAGDPMRLGAQVVSGIGFLGAGTIIVTQHSQIRGLTTAAGLWASAGVGLAFGVGFYEAAITATVGIYAILTILQRWESRLRKKVRLLEVYIEWQKTVPLQALTQQIRDMGLEIESVQFEPELTSETGTRAIVASLKAKEKADQLLLMQKLEALHGVTYLEAL